MLRERCSGMLYYGPVRVSKEARAGKAVVRVELVKGSQFKSLPTEIEVKLVEKKKE